MERRTKVKNSQGITLIALVISIIVMLILAGVSINALVGDNGVLTQTQYASFLNEMSTVEEAVAIWKAGEAINAKGAETTAIPTNGMCSAIELQNTERLVGEVGYYRVWSIGGTRPVTNVESAPATFNSSFESELIFFPAGVQDLYYLNNDLIGINGNKKYIIDASTGMIYSMSGIGIKGTRVYSSAMAKAVMNGDMTAPLFAEAEVSGSGSGEAFAGNATTQYVDASGNPVYKKPDGTYVDANGNPVNASDVKDNSANYNPNGFQIYADYRSNNLYKLYNNGDLYAKGVKGTQLNTSASDMQAINPAKFSEFTIPSEVGSYKKMIAGSGTVYFIDANDNLWALGNNSENKLSLTQEQQVEFTGREITKLNVNNKKVDMCWDVGEILFVRTKDNELYACGASRAARNYCFGNNSQDEISSFIKINFEKVDKIDYVHYQTDGSGGRNIIIACTDNTFYGSGAYAGSFSGLGGGAYKLFCPLFNGYKYDWDSTTSTYVQSSYNASADIDQDIKKITNCGNGYSSLLILKKDNTLWKVGSSSLCAEAANSSSFVQLPEATTGSNVKDVIGLSYSLLIVKNDNTAYGSLYYNDCLGVGETNVWVSKPITLPSALVSSGIKEVFSFGSGVYYLSNDNKLYGSGNYSYLCKSADTPGVIKIDTDLEMNSFYDSISNSINENNKVPIFKGKDNKLYSIGDANLLFRDNILQKNWTKITDMKVKKVKVGENNSLAIVDYNNDLYVCGADCRVLGLNKSEMEPVNNLVKVNDSNINGKVKDVNFTGLTMNVLTNEGKVYVTGRFSSDGVSLGWPNGGYPGWIEHENHYTLTLIDIDNVTMINSNEKDQIVVANNKIYTWGCNFYNGYYQASETPIESKFNDIVDGANVKQIFNSRPASIILLNDGSLYIDGGNHGISESYSGIGRANRKLENMTDKFEGNTIFSYANSLGIALFLTNNGKVYGYGQKNRLGINNMSPTITDVIQRLSVGTDSEIVTQVAVGNEYAIAITDKGKVYGTGSNLYGVLGRWIGVDRSTPNSRYKTAFEWVECPELEI